MRRSRSSGYDNTRCVTAKSTPAPEEIPGRFFCAGYLPEKVAAETGSYRAPSIRGFLRQDMFNSKQFWIGVVIASVAWIAFGYWNSSRTTN
jgi:hypothetical protein